VIELEDDDVGLSTVDARVRKEILDHLGLVLVLPFGTVAKESCLLGLAILLVVARIVFREARAAPRLELGLTTAHWWK